jgi:uncharacterized repeat protein (TIGR03803 family)
MLLGTSLPAQTFTTLHSFTVGADGAYPVAGLTVDQVGNLYGTTCGGGAGFGSAFKLKRLADGWTFNPLYSFAGMTDGNCPLAGVVIGANGSLYGTTYQGGNGCNGVGCGTIYNLRPPPRTSSRVFGDWRETVLYRFVGSNDGSDPGYGGLVFDQTGSLYGTTCGGGSSGAGTVYKLTPGADWTQSVLYSFGGDDGLCPLGGVIFDQAGNLYGTTSSGGIHDKGTVFELMPSGSGWTARTLHAFQGAEGSSPVGGLIFDALGNLYGTTSAGGSGGGVVFMLAPSDGDWLYTAIHSFSGSEGPYSKVVMDARGNLYGTTVNDGAFGLGSVFELTPSHGAWTFVTLHDFTGGNDGRYPYGNALLDSDSSLYGTAFQGGTGSGCPGGCGVVWKITP